jgi:hypothetical protein
MPENSTETISRLPVQAHIPKLSYKLFASYHTLLPGSGGREFHQASDWGPRGYLMVRVSRSRATNKIEVLFLPESLSLFCMSPSACARAASPGDTQQNPLVLVSPVKRTSCRQSRGIG